MKKTTSTTLLLIVLLSLGYMAKAQKTAPTGFGKNLLTISPIALTDQGLSLGISYERALDDKGIVQFSLPLFYTFSSVDDEYGYYGNNRKQPSMFYAYPGIKIYPTGAYGLIRYGIGPSFVVAGGNTYDYRAVYEPNTGQYLGTQSITESRFIFGVMVTNSLNVNFNKKFYIGTELGLGISYINQLDGYRDGTTGLARLGFSFGYRF